MEVNTVPPSMSVKHTKAKVTPTQTMKLPKVPPETRPGRDAMFGNAPLDPVEYIPRQKSEDYSKAYLKEMVYADSQCAQQVIEASFTHTNKNLSIICTVLRIYDKNSFNEAADLIDEKLSSLESYYISRIDAVTEELESCIEEENRRVAFHDRQRSYLLPISTPYSLRYITCIKLLDRLVSRLEAKKLVGLIGYTDFDKTIEVERSLLFTFAREVYHERLNRLIDARKKVIPGVANEIARAEQLAAKNIDAIDADKKEIHSRGGAKNDKAKTETLVSI